MSGSTLANGQSEIDTVVLRLPDIGVEVKNWSRYTYSEAFLTPTAGWSFTVSDEDPSITGSLVEGARVELVIGANVQCSGYIEKKRIDTDTGDGTVITVQGRDILGPVVDATMDPAFKFAAGVTVGDFLAAVLAPFGIKTIYNADQFNIYLVSGFAKGSGPGQPYTVKQAQQHTVVGSDGTLTLNKEAVDATVYVSPLRPDLKALKVTDTKPRAGESVWQYVGRLLHRLGLTMWAAGDGSGVVIDRPDFATPPELSITHKLVDTSKNNVKRGSLTTDFSTQPSAIIATGRGGGAGNATTGMRILMLNELVGLDDAGGPLPKFTDDKGNQHRPLQAIADIADRYPSAKVLPIRSALTPFTRPVGDPRIARPWFLKDDEAANLAQLEAFVRRKMAEVQNKALQVEYDLVGHTSQGHPWTINTLVAVDDDKLGVHENLWIMERLFSKTKNGGTLASLKLIRPFTLQIGDA